MANKINMPVDVPRGLCAFNCGEECVALIKKKCIGCKFRKTAEQVVASRKASYERLISIGADQLIEKYWKTDKV